MRIRLTRDIRQDIVDIWGFEGGEGWGLGLLPDAVVEVDGPNEEGGFFVRDTAGNLVNILSGEFVVVGEGGEGDG